MKKALLFLVLSISIFSSGYSANNFSDFASTAVEGTDFTFDFSTGWFGTNTINSFIAKTPLGLAKIAQLINDGSEYSNKNKKYKLNANLTVSLVAGEYDFSKIGNKTYSDLYWTPIGTVDNPYQGSFKGSGAIIKNLKIKASATKKDALAGLFGYVMADTKTLTQFSDVTFSDCTIEAEMTNTSDMGNGSINPLNSYAACLVASFKTGDSGNKNGIKFLNIKVENSCKIVANNYSIDCNYYSGAASVVSYVFTRSTELLFDKCENFATIKSYSLCWNDDTEMVAKHKDQGTYSSSGGIVAIVSIDDEDNGSTKFQNCVSKADSIYAYSVYLPAYAGGLCGGVIPRKNLSFDGGSVSGCIIAESKFGKSYAGGVAGAKDVSASDANAGVDMKHVGLSDLLLKGDVVGSLISNMTPTTSGNKEESITIVDTSDNVILDLSTVNSGNAYYDYSKYQGDANRIIISLKNADREIKVQGKSSSKSIVLDTRNYVGTLNCSTSNIPSVESLVLGANTIQEGRIVTNTSLEFYDGAIISENGITNGNGYGRIYYHRSPSIWGTSEQTGWQTICLPFDAQVYVYRNSTNSELTPISEYFDSNYLNNNYSKKEHFTSSSSNGDYWLKEMSNTSMTSDAVRVTYVHHSKSGITKNTPFAVCFPGNEWGNEYDMSNKGGEIIFVGQGNYPAFSSLTGTTNGEKYGYLVFQGVFRKTNIADVSGTVKFVLNSEDEIVSYDNNWDLLGNKYVQTDDFANMVLKPYRAYLTNTSYDKDDAKLLRISEIPFDSGSDLSTGFGLSREDNVGVTFFSNDGVLIVNSEVSQRLVVYNLSGSIVKCVEIQAGESVIDDLARGIYLICGKKVVL